MALDGNSFRVAYPVFADLIAYPPEAVAYWIGIAVSRLDPIRWSTLLDEGTALFVAHRLALSKMAATGAVNGAFGMVSSKSVGGVSIAYNYEVGRLENGGAYNLTVYGIEFLTLARMVGTGGIQL